MISEHRDLLSAVRSVESLTETGYCATGDAARKLRRLASMWKEHVESEEGSPLYTDTAHCAATVRAELAELKEQHEPIAAELQAVADAADSAETLELTSELAIRLRKLIAKMRHHEASEAEILHNLTPPSGPDG